VPLSCAMSISSAEQANPGVLVKIYAHRPERTFCLGDLNYLMGRSLSREPAVSTDERLCRLSAVARDGRFGDDGVARPGELRGGSPVRLCGSAPGSREIGESQDATARPAASCFHDPAGIAAVDLRAAGRSQAWHTARPAPPIGMIEASPLRWRASWRSRRSHSWKALVEQSARGVPSPRPEQLRVAFADCRSAYSVPSRCRPRPRPERGDGRV
jgi:hypothetical protein